MIKTFKEEFTDHEFQYLNMHYLACGQVYWKIDDNYGADADGARGSTRKEFDRIWIDSIVDEDGVEVRKWPQALREALEESFSP